MHTELRVTSSIVKFRHFPRHFCATPSHVAFTGPPPCILTEYQCNVMHHKMPNYHTTKHWCWPKHEFNKTAICDEIFSRQFRKFWSISWHLPHCWQSPWGFPDHTNQQNNDNWLQSKDNHNEKNIYNGHNISQQWGSHFRSDQLNQAWSSNQEPVCQVVGVVGIDRDSYTIIFDCQKNRVVIE